MLKVRVHSPTPDDVRALLEGVPGLEVVSGPSAAADAALIAFDMPTDEDISGYGWVHVGGAGADRVLAALAGKARVPILTRTTGAMGRQIGEYVLGYILADLQKMAVRQAFAREGDWQKQASMPDYLFDQTVMIVGTGAMGSAIAGVLKPLAKRVMGVSRSGAPAEGFDDVHTMDDLPQADILVAALPGTTATAGIVGEAVFKAVCPRLFINIGRGISVDDAALLRALDEEHVGRAVLDVFAEEPLPASRAYWAHSRVTVTPHVSGVTRPVDIAEAFLARKEIFMAGTLESEIDPKAGY